MQIMERVSEALPALAPTLGALLAGEWVDEDTLASAVDAYLAGDRDPLDDLIEEAAEAVLMDGVEEGPI